MEYNNLIHVFNEIKPNTRSATVSIGYEVGSMKLVRNHNRVLNTGEFMTIIYSNDHPNFNNIKNTLKEGNFISTGDYNKIQYMIDRVKGTRLSVDKNGIERWQFYVFFVGLEILLQKTLMPNKALSQLVVGDQKTVGLMINEYVTNFFNIDNIYNIKTFENIDKNLEIEINYPDLLEVAQENTWMRSSLYDIINDMIKQKYYLSVYFIWALFPQDNKMVIDFIDMTEPMPNKFIDDSIISRIEVGKDLEQNPKTMSIDIENALINTMFEKRIPGTTEIGVMDDKDESTRFETTFGIGNIKHAYLEGLLPKRELAITDGIGEIYHLYGHKSGYAKIEITPMIITKEIYDSMIPLANQLSNWEQLNLSEYLPNAENYKNFYVYYEKGKNYVGGVLENLTKKILLTFTDFNLMYLLNYIFYYYPELVMEFPMLTSESEEIEIHRFIENSSIKNFKLTIEYEILDDVRYDIIKKEGSGQLAQNQSSVYINFENYIKQQENIFEKFDGEEKVGMGRYYRGESIGDLVEGASYGSNDELLSQITTIDFIDYVDWAGIISSKTNRIDSDSYINTQKRFYNIVDVSDSVRRTDFFEIDTTGTALLNLLKTNKNDIYCLLITKNANNETLQQVLMRPLVYETTDEITFFGKALDNKYVGKKVVQEGAYKVTDGVFYTDADTGEFYSSQLSFITADGLPHNNYPSASGMSGAVAIYTIHDFIRLKDSAEKIAFTVKFKKRGV